MDHMTYEEYLEKNGRLIYRNVGTSMLPLLKQGRDLFIVEKKTGERCKKYDVVLYRRPPEEYVLHRIIKVLPDGYVIRGDNCMNKEYGIRDEDILGVMTGLIRNGTTHPLKGWRYWLYIHTWCDIFAIRWVLTWAKRFAGKCKRCLVK